MPPVIQSQPQLELRPGAHMDMASLRAVNERFPSEFVPPCLGPRSRLSAWEELGADKVLIRAIAEGVRLPLNGMPPPSVRRPVDDALLQTLAEYESIGVVRRMTQEEQLATKY